MRQYKILFFFLFTTHSWLIAQTPVVTNRIHFADMTLTLTQEARKEVQTEVDALIRSPKYFNLMLARVDFYFPVIEDIIEEEGLPDDFKYLVIQESGLVSDVVSTSQAVGFWQFKKATAQEVGLRVDRNVDERKNIIAATRGAARYLIRNNFYFNNWVYAMLSYYHGRSGAEKIVDKKYYGAKKMEITKHTHWYFKKYLAHKIAFEQAISKNPYPKWALVRYNKGENKTLREIARKFSIDENELKRYNKWLTKGKVPDDKVYDVILPVEVPENEALITLGDNYTYEKVQVTTVNEQQKFPVIIEKNGKKLMNGLPGFIAQEGDKISLIVKKAGLSEKKFRKVNDLSQMDKLVVGQVYYLKNKKSRAKVPHHVVLYGETIWSIAQLYGIKLKKLMGMNRLEKMEYLRPGRILWLQKKRPAEVPVAYQPLPETIKKMPDTLKSRLTEAPKDTVANPNIGRKDTLTEVSPPIIDTVALTSVSALDSTKVEEIETGSLTSENTQTDEFHIVKKGDTLYSISKYYRVTIEDLMQWNNKENFDIGIGEKLLIKLQ